MILRASASTESLTSPVNSAHRAGLRYVTDRMPGIRRERAGRGVRYRYPTGELVREPEVWKRIKALAIPPAWTEVWICPDPAGHLQATGRDARGRKQNRYHRRWREVRDDTKFARMSAFGRALPGIRRRVAQDLALPGTPREKILAAVVRLLELSRIRIGNDEYARENNSFGLTTMRNRHVQVRGSRLRFHFQGKGGKRHEVDIEDRRLARIVKQCQDLPGQELFQYVNGEGRPQGVNSENVNEYLRQITGQDFTAKDFRTWAGTVLAGRALGKLKPFKSRAEAKKNIVEAIEWVARGLGNTPAVCRKCYVHPDVVAAYQEGTLAEALQKRDRAARGKSGSGLPREEAAVLAFLCRRVAEEPRRLEKALKMSLAREKYRDSAARGASAASRFRMQLRRVSRASRLTRNGG